MGGELPQPGQQLGSYEVLAEIARGGMAAVYLARQRFEVAGLRRLVAVKVLLPHLHEAEFVQMFLDEARVALAITHPHIVQVLDVGHADGFPHISMEYLRGKELGSVVSRMPVGVERDAVIYQVLAQATSGLHAAHETVGDDGAPLAIVHRDVTPSNIHVGYDGCVKIVDFGIAASRGRITSTRPDVLKGTLQYLAPEQINRSHQIDRRVDIWALGVIAWELLSGQKLFHGSHEAMTLWNVIEKTVPDIRELAPRIPDDVARAITACLQRDPNRRPASLRSIESVFTRAAQQGGIAGQRELAAVMERTFGPERDDEDTKVEIVVRSVPVAIAATPALEAGRPSTTLSHAASMMKTTAAPPRKRSSWWPALAIVGVSAAAVVWIGFASDLSGPANDADASEPPIQATQAIAPAPIVIPAPTAMPAPPPAPPQAPAPAPESAPPDATPAPETPPAPAIVHAKHKSVKKQRPHVAPVAKAPAAVRPSPPPPPAPAPAPQPQPAPATDGPLLHNPYNK